MPLSIDERLVKFQSMVQRFPDSEVPRFSLAQVLFEAGRFDECQATAAEVVRLRPDFLMAWLLRARSLALLERWTEAQPIAEHARGLAIAQHHSEPRADAEALLEEIAAELG